MTSKWIVRRLAVLFGPPILFVSYLVLSGRLTDRDIPTWAGYTITTYFVLCIAISALSARRKSSQPRVSPEADLQLQAKAQKIWTVMLALYLQAFLGSAVAFIVLRKRVWWEYGAIALAINLLFIIVLCRALFWNSSGKRL